MSSDWPEVTVGEIATLITKGTTPTTLGYAFQDNGVRFVKVETLSEDGQFLEDKFAFISDEAHRALLRSQLQEDDVLFTIAGTIGRTGIVDSRHLPANTNQAVALVRPDKRMIEPQFLRYVLSNRAFTRNAHSKTVQSVQANFSLGELKQSRFKLPSPDEQREVLSVLGPLDDRITLLRQTNATQEAIAQALFKSWFVDFDPVRAKMAGRTPEGMDVATAALFPDSLEETELGLVPKGWLVDSVGNLAEKIGMGPFGSDIKVSTFRPEGVPVLNGKNLQTLLLDDECSNFVSADHAAKLSKSCVQPGDIVITHRGTLGQASLIPDGLAHEMFVASQSQFFMRCLPSKMKPEWMIYFLRSPLGQHLLLSNKSQVGVPSIARPVTHLKSIKLVVAPVELIQRFSDLVGLLHVTSVANRSRGRVLASLRDQLLPRLISGQLRLPEAQTQLEPHLS